MPDGVSWEPGHKKGAAMALEFAYEDGYGVEHPQAYVRVQRVIKEK